MEDTILLNNIYELYEIWELKRYINKYKKSSIQKSKKWISERSKLIGGSEIGTVLGYNQYSDITKLINNKKNNTEQIKIIACQWGILFEDIAVECFEYLRDTKIYGSQISIVNDDIYGFRYSPDGYCILNGDIYLLEFKCPIRRLAKENTIPKNYEAQIQSGLNVSNITNKGLYCEFEFRLSTLKDYKENNRFYYKKYHLSDRKKTWPHPVAKGLILIKKTDKDDITKIIGDDDFENSEIDYIFNNNHIYEYKIEFNNEEKINVNYDDYRYILPWKLFNINYVYINKNYDFFNKELMLKIENIIKELNDYSKI